MYRYEICRLASRLALPTGSERRACRAMTYGTMP